MQRFQTTASRFQIILQFFYILRGALHSASFAQLHLGIGTSVVLLTNCFEEAVHSAFFVRQRLGFKAFCSSFCTLCI